MRFVLHCYAATRNDIRLLTLLGKGLRQASNEEHTVIVTDMLDDKLNYADVVLSVDVARPDNLPRNIRHIAWVQDLINRPENAIVPERQYYVAKAASDDIIYTLGDGRSVGIDEKDPHWRGSLTEGVDESLFETNYRLAQDLDISFVGYVPNPIEHWYYWDERSLQFFLNVISSNYRALEGGLDPLKIYHLLCEYIVSDIDDQACQELKWLIIEYARYLDRISVAKMMLKVSEKCELRGPNWDKYSAFAAFSKPHSADAQVLHDTYLRSKINLHVNITGFGIHSRVLECMALGCFVMSHHTIRNCPGQLNASFEPDAHYGVFSIDDFRRRARFWLENHEARNKVTEDARKLVRAEHLWRHRGAQILKDLQ